MSYTANSERTFQALQAERTKSVQKLRAALLKAGVQERMSFPPSAAVAQAVGLSLAPLQQIFDIESVIRNATEIRAALADFDASITPPPTVGD